LEKSTFTPQYQVLRKKLVSMRKGAGLSQRELASRLKRVRSFVENIELGERRVDLVEFVWICQACKVKPAEAILELLKGFKKRTRGSSAPKG
jgi:transcriptional regulator with XRE-family HTH domain